jgi:transcriptional regulator with XRE-family HTH domain
VSEASLVPKPIDLVVGGRLAALRMRSGISQQELAALLEVPKNWVAGYEEGVVRVAAADLIEMCQFFRVKLEDLFPNYEPGRNQKLH